MASRSPSLSSSDNGICNEYKIFAALEVRLTGLETWLCTMESNIFPGARAGDGKSNLKLLPKDTQKYNTIIIYTGGNDARATEFMVTVFFGPYRTKEKVNNQMWTVKYQILFVTVALTPLSFLYLI